MNHGGDTAGRTRGYAVVWVLVALAVAAGTVALATGGGGGLDRTRTSLLAVAALVVVAGLAVELRRDPWEVAAIGAASGVSGAIVFGLVAGVDVTPSPVARVAAVVFGAIGAISALALWRESRRAEPAPNVLPRLIPGAMIAESNGVHVALEVPAEARVARTALIYLQNCFDAERQVEVVLEAEHVPAGSAIMRAVGGGGRAIRIPQKSHAESRLEPLEVAVMSMPFRVLPGPHETVDLVASVSIAGESGRRVRRWRAPTAMRKLSPWKQFLLSMLTREFVSGGGLRHRLVVPESSSASEASEMARPAWRPLWRPGWGAPSDSRRRERDRA